MSRENRALRPLLWLLSAAAGCPGPDERGQLAAMVETVGVIRDEISCIDFWPKQIAKQEPRHRVVRHLDDHDLVPLDKQEALRDQILQTARANHTSLVG